MPTHVMKYILVRGFLALFPLSELRDTASRRPENVNLTLLAAEEEAKRLQIDNQYATFHSSTILTNMLQY